MANDGDPAVDRLGLQPPRGYHNTYGYRKYLGWSPDHLATLHSQGVI